MTKKTTKRALVSSLLVLVLCFTMLLGTTFAWFTDSASSVGNKITTGNLDVDLYRWSENGSTEITANSDPIFPGTITWEPGMTQVVYLSIKNNGSLDLKYKVGLEVKNVTKNLTDVMSYAITPDATFGTLTGWVGNGLSVVSGTNVAANDVVLGAGAEHFFALSVHMDEEAGNEYMNGTIEFDINVLAGQLASELDSFDNTYDADATYPTVSTSYVVPENATTNAVVETTNVKVNVPAAVLNALPDDVESIQLAHSDVKTDATAKTLAFDAVEFIDQNGNIIDLANNTTPFEVTLPVGDVFAAGATVEIYHDGEIVATAVVSNDKTVTYTVTHFCAVSLNLPTAVVTTYDELKAALADKNIAKVVMANDITAQATESNGYGKTGVVVKDGKILDGNGYTLKITGAGATWDSAINAKNGTIQNITVAGAMRGIFTGGTDGDIYMNNVTFSGVVYTFNSDGGNKNYGVYANNCNFNGWTSFSNVHKEVVFTDCTFAKGSGYEFARPYNPTVFNGCTFAEGYVIDTTRTTMTFTNCNYAGTVMTAENAADLAIFPDSIANCTFN